MSESERNSPFKQHDPSLKLSANTTPISWNTNWDSCTCSSSSCDSSKQDCISSSGGEKKTIAMLKPSMWYHRNLLKRTSDEKFEVKHFRKFRLECTEITAALRDSRQSLLQSMIISSTIDKFEQSFDLLREYLNLFYCFVWAFDDNHNKSKIIHQPTSKLSMEFIFEWSDSIDGQFRSERDSLFELVSMIYQYALYLMKNIGNISTKLEQLGNREQKSLRTAAILLRIISDQFLSNSSLILTKLETDLDPNIVQAYGFQCLAEEREIELLKWIRSEIDGHIWKWQKLVEISGQAKMLFQRANSHLRIEYFTTTERLPLWRLYLRYKISLHQTINLIHCGLIKSVNNRREALKLFDGTKKLLESYNELSLATNTSHSNNLPLDHVGMFEWIEGLIKLLPNHTDSVTKSDESNCESEIEMKDVLAHFDVPQQKEVQHMISILFRKHKMWSKKIYDAFAGGDSKDSINFLQNLHWKKSRSSLRVHSQPIPVTIDPICKYTSLKFNSSDNYDKIFNSNKAGARKSKLLRVVSLKSFINFGSSNRVSRITTQQSSIESYSINNLQQHSFHVPVSNTTHPRLFSFSKKPQPLPKPRNLKDEQITNKKPNISWPMENNNYNSLYESFNHCCPSSSPSNLIVNGDSSFSESKYLFFASMTGNGGMKDFKEISVDDKESFVDDVQQQNFDQPLTLRKMSECQLSPKKLYPISIVSESFSQLQTAPRLIMDVKPPVPPKPKNLKILIPEYLIQRLPNGASINKEQ